MASLFKVLGTLALMLVSGAGATLLALSFFMNLGLKRYDNYETYGSFPVVILILGIGLLGFVVPGVVAWHLHKSSWHFSLRELLIAVTLVAVVLGVYVLSL